MQTTPIALEKVRMAPAVALGFFIVGILSLSATLAIMLLHPQIASGDPYRLEFLAFGALVLFGFVGSFAFGSAYVIAPVMGGGSLFNDRLTFYHLLLHGSGLACLILVFGGMDFLKVPRVGLVVGVGLILLGAAAHIVNLVVTASRHNRWEPEQLTLMSALFWLGLTGLLGAAVLLHQFRPFLEQDPRLLLESHAPLGLIGFIWLGLMGCSLKLFLNLQPKRQCKQKSSSSLLSSPPSSRSMFWPAMPVIWASPDKSPTNGPTPPSDAT